MLAVYPSEADGLAAGADSDVIEVSFGVALRALGEVRPWGFNGQPQGHRFGEVDTTVTGAGVSVAIVDAGIDCNGPDFTLDGTSLCGLSYSFVPGYSAYSDHGNGHGTAVASIIAARRNGTGLEGEARNAGVASYLVSAGTGSGCIPTVFDPCNPEANCNVVAAAIDQATYDLRDIINVSFGVDDTPYNRNACRSMESAVNFAYQAGLFVVAGNGDYHAYPAIPAAYDNAFAVAALECGAGSVDDGTQPCASSATLWSGSGLTGGPHVDISAAGAHVQTAAVGGGVFCCWSGTSMAAPSVAAAAALLIERYPEARRQSQSIAAHLKAYAYLPTGGYDPNKYGAGILDAAAALQVSPCVTRACIEHPDP